MRNKIIPNDIGAILASASVRMPRITRQMRLAAKADELAYRIVACTGQNIEEFRECFKEWQSHRGTNPVTSLEMLHDEAKAGMSMPWENK